MKSLLIKLLKQMPLVYDIVKKLYQLSFQNKKLVIEIEKNADQKKNIMLKVFSSNFVVHNGPFKGMQYISESNGSAHLPKILGSYEEPIQEWINNAIKKEYKTIIDIGCAEGYYAVGFGMRMPGTKVIAYEIDDNARKNTKELVELNKQNNIEIRSECTFEELNNECNENTLIFCDVEGYEDILLDPIKVPNLSLVDLIIESHDFMIPNLTEKLITRFYDTHSIKIVVDYPFRKNNYHTPSETTDYELSMIIDESRPPAMKFLLLESKSTLFRK